MSDTEQKTYPHIRTYAGDLETAREAKGLVSEKKKTAVTAEEKPHEKGELAVAASPKSIPSPAHEKDSVPPAAAETKEVGAGEKLAVAASPKSIPSPAHEKDSAHTTQAKKEPTKIPSFHEAQKQFDAIEVESDVVKKAKEKFKKSAAKDPKHTRPNIGFDATVITDTKSGRFKLIPSVIDSLKSWYKHLTTAKKKRVPKYTIPEASRRKGVIQKATSKSGSIFTADNETLKEQIRRRQQQEQTEDEGFETTWSPFTESGYNLLEAPDDYVPADTTANVQVEYKKQRTQDQTAKHLPFRDSTAKTTPTEATVTIPTPEPISEPEPTPEPIPPAEAEVAPVNEPEPVAEVSSPEPEPEPAYEPEEILPTQTTPQPQQKFNRLDTNTLTVTVLLTIVGLVIAVFVGRVLFIYLTAETTPETTNTTVAAILNNTNLRSIVLTSEKVDSLTSVIKTSVAGTEEGMTEFVLVSPFDNELKASFIIEGLRFKVMPSLKQAISTAHFVTTNGSAPAIVLTYADKTTVQGGFLYWETSMLDDLRTLYDLEASAGTFSDKVIAGRQTRVLVDENNEPLLMYALVNDTTAIIAPTEQLFAQIITTGLPE